MALETLEQHLDVVLLQLEALHDLVQLRHVDAAVLFSVLDEDCDRVVRHRSNPYPPFTWL